MGHKWGQCRGEEPGRGSRGEAIKAILCAVHTLTGNRNENRSLTQGTGIFFFLLPGETKNTVLANEIELMLRKAGVPGEDSITDNLKEGRGCLRGVWSLAEAGLSGY